MVRGTACRRGRKTVGNVINKEVPFWERYKAL